MRHCFPCTGVGFGRASQGSWLWTGDFHRPITSSCQSPRDFSGMSPQCSEPRCLTKPRWFHSLLLPVTHPVLCSLYLLGSGKREFPLQTDPRGNVRQSRKRRVRNLRLQAEGAASQGAGGEETGSGVLALRLAGRALHLRELQGRPHTHTPALRPCGF